MRNLIAPAALVASLMLGSAAFAATPQAATSDSGMATAAPPVVQQQIVGRTTIDAPIERDSVSRPVSYGDLNLADRADVKVLDQRIDNTARQDCAQLRTQFPPFLNPTISGGHCVAAAERNAKEAVAPAIAAARDSEQDSQ